MSSQWSHVLLCTVFGVDTALAALMRARSLLKRADPKHPLRAWETQDQGALFQADGYPVATCAASGFRMATFPERH